MASKREPAAPKEVLWTEGLYRLVHLSEGRPLPLWGGKDGLAAVLPGAQKPAGRELERRGLVERTGEEATIGKAAIPLVRATPDAARWLESSEAHAETLARCRERHAVEIRRGLAAAESGLESATAAVRSIVESISGLLGRVEGSLASLSDAARSLAERAASLREAAARFEGTKIPARREPAGAPAPRPGSAAVESEIQAAYAKLVAGRGDRIVSFPDLYRTASPERSLGVEAFHAAILALRDRGVVELIRPGNATGLPDLELAIHDERGYVYYLEWRR